MSRSFVPVVGVLATLCGFGHLAYADVCPAPVPFTVNECSVSGTLVNGIAEVSFPQINFNQALGTAFDFDFLLSATLSGTLGLSFTCPPFEMGVEPFCDYGATFTPALSSSPGSPISFSVMGDHQGAFLSCAGNSNGQTCNTGFPWSDAIDDATIAQDYDSTQPNYNAALARLVTGTGELKFGLTESLSNLMAGNNATVITGSSFNPSPHTVTLQYLFTPSVPVPEPSLAPVAAALFGLIVWRRRRRRATTFSARAIPEARRRGQHTREGGRR